MPKILSEDLGHFYLLSTLIKRSNLTTFDAILITDRRKLFALSEERHNAVLRLAACIDLANPVSNFTCFRITTHKRRVESCYILVVLQLEADKLGTREEVLRSGAACLFKVSQS